MSRAELVAKILEDVANVFEDKECMEALAQAGTLRDAMSNMCRFFAQVAREIEEDE